MNLIPRFLKRSRIKWWTTVYHLNNGKKGVRRSGILLRLTRCNRSPTRGPIRTFRAKSAATRSTGLARINYRGDAEDAERSRRSSTRKFVPADLASCAPHTKGFDPLSQRPPRLCGESCIFWVRWNGKGVRFSTPAAV